MGAKGRSERVLTNRLCLVQYIKTHQAEGIVLDIKVIQALAQEVVRAHRPETEHFSVSRDWASKFKKRQGGTAALWLDSPPQMPLPPFCQMHHERSTGVQ